MSILLRECDVRRCDDPEYVRAASTLRRRGCRKPSELYDVSIRRLFNKAGIKPGMKMLDDGSGAGVAMLAADMVGPSGQVVSVDSNPNILEIGRQRASSAGPAQVSFVPGDVRVVAGTAVATLPEAGREMGAGVAVVIAVLFAMAIRAAFIKPLFLISMLVRFHTLIEEQPINMQWSHYLDQLSPDLGRKRSA